MRYSNSEIIPSWAVRYTPLPSVVEARSTATSEARSSPTSVLPMSPDSLLLAKSVSPLPAKPGPPLPAKPVSPLPAKLDRLLPAYSQRSQFHPYQRSRIHLYQLAPGEASFPPTSKAGSTCTSLLPAKPVSPLAAMPDPLLPAFSQRSQIVREVSCSQRSQFHPYQRSRNHCYQLAPSEIRWSER